MTPNEFFAAVTLDPTMEYLGVQDGCVVVRAGRYVWSIDPEEILAGDVLAVLREEIEPEPLRHIARIVGYYSVMRNWNKSKVAEQYDRGLGEYSVPSGPITMLPVQWPDDVLALAAAAGAGMQCKA